LKEIGQADGHDAPLANDSAELGHLERLGRWVFNKEWDGVKEPKGLRRPHSLGEVCLIVI